MGTAVESADIKKNCNSLYSLAARHPLIIHVLKKVGGRNQISRLRLRHSIAFYLGSSYLRRRYSCTYMYMYMCVYICIC